MLGIVCWVLGIVTWVSGIVFWVSGFVFWVSGFVLWVHGAEQDTVSKEKHGFPTPEGTFLKQEFLLKRSRCTLGNLAASAAPPKQEHLQKMHMFYNFFRFFGVWSLDLSVW